MGSCHILGGTAPYRRGLEIPGYMFLGYTIGWVNLYLYEKIIKNIYMYNGQSEHISKGIGIKYLEAMG